KDYAGKKPLLVAVLRGAFIFTADLMRAINIPSEVDFMAVSSYGSGAQTSGVVRIIKDLSTSIENRDVLIVEDVLDSGLTLTYLMRNLASRNPASLKMVALLHKEGKQETDLKPDYVGFSCPDEFVVGYGLDFAEDYRQLPYIGILKPEMYE
ncbi:MAG: hypoxanthine phosphoribosyltransferase, partial [Coriobacteriia bacterium]|nr:hypoxanthine phosphoribosyltransferase [Coriobacteriia bacterium]